MRRLTIVVFLFGFLMVPVTVPGAELQKGLDAFSVGDYETAMAECMPLAEEGNVEAMFCVGRMYANGFGVPMDDAQALKWYGLAAGEGHPEALYNLALMHANGWGVAMNDVPAAGFYRLAAGFGYTPAQTAMGFCYKHGAGVERDLGKAYMWFEIAAHNGDRSAASERDSLGDRLTQDEIRVAKQSASDWLNSHEGQARQVGLTE